MCQGVSIRGSACNIDTNNTGTASNTNTLAHNIDTLKVYLRNTYR